MDYNPLAVDVFDRRAEDYQTKFMDVSLYHDTFDVFCNSIHATNPEILELACGPGNITRYLLQKRPDLRILATDLAPNMLTLAQLNNPVARCQLLDCRQILSLGQTFDAIMCGFCLPYLSQEETQQLFADSAQILNERGVLYISTMEDDYNKSGFKSSSDGKDRTYTYYYTGDFLCAELSRNQFEVLHLQRKDFTSPSGAITTDIVIIARKV